MQKCKIARNWNWNSGLIFPILYCLLKRCVACADWAMATRFSNLDLNSPTIGNWKVETHILELISDLHRTFAPVLTFVHWRLLLSWCISTYDGWDEIWTCRLLSTVNHCLNHINLFHPGFYQHSLTPSVCHHRANSGQTSSISADVPGKLCWATLGWTCIDVSSVSWRLFARSNIFLFSITFFFFNLLSSSIFPLKLKAGKLFVFGAEHQTNFKPSASVPLSLSAMCQFTACNESLFMVHQFSAIVNSPFKTFEIQLKITIYFEFKLPI